ncbi:hypothetical protein MSG28_010439 [Choristoneura fumiferana]|uniref:Uncharacterized protein n=1 Tax=Choristoneura fumiferana TaxID=7141 RepID=A0ACC0KL37_CHOFU|nr:hypothetical protein MSG28_010439 [Choristoneura fumiferana]
MGEKFCGEEVGRGYWGWMSSMGPGELVEIGGRMNSERYLEVLKDVMLPSVRVAYPEGQIYLVHDNSSVHKSKIVKDWLNSQKDITEFEWPAKSPDLNPIENLWGQMVLNWDSSEIRSKKNLDNEAVQGQMRYDCSGGRGRRPRAPVSALTSRYASMTSCSSLREPIQN